MCFFYLYPLYLRALGSSEATIGWIMGLLPVSTVAVRPSMGKLVGRWGEGRVIQLGLVVIFCSSLAYHGLEKVGMLMAVVRLLHGVGFSAFVAGAFTAVARWVQPGNRGRAYSYVGATILAAVAVVPGAGEIILQGFGYPGLFNSAAAAVFLAAIVAGSIGLWTPEARVSPPGSTRYLALLQRPSVLLLLVAILLFFQAYACVLNFIVLHGRRLQISGGLYLAVSAGLAFFLRLGGGTLIDRYGRLPFMRWSAMLFAAGICLIPFIKSPWFFLCSSLLYGGGLAFVQPAAMALAADLARTDAELPAIMSITTATFDLGFILGTILAGWVAEMSSLGTMFLVAGILSFGSFFLTFAPMTESRAESDG